MIYEYTTPAVTSLKETPFDTLKRKSNGDGYKVMPRQVKGLRKGRTNKDIPEEGSDYS
jgi:hypothetical protein